MNRNTSYVLNSNAINWLQVGVEWCIIFPLFLRLLNKACLYISFCRTGKYLRSKKPLFPLLARCLVYIGSLHDSHITPLPALYNSGFSYSNYLLIYWAKFCISGGKIPPTVNTFLLQMDRFDKMTSPKADRTLGSGYIRRQIFLTGHRAYSDSEEPGIDRYLKLQFKTSIGGDTKN
jgi:hypothetical protein